MRGETTVRALAIGQGAWFLAAGIWPLLHEASFEAVTGPKRERWLVKTVGVLVAAVGATLLLAARQRSISPEARLLGASSAAGLAAIELWYAGVRRRIAPVYLADAVAELGLLTGWGITAASRSAAGAAAVREGAAATTR
ncbi:MAG TPA: hypothetical protein VFX50_18635 [Gemmatimonadales bacterium]|nr:hypothetical protein [Gemmatimonadales bacterium]